MVMGPEKCDLCGTVLKYLKREHATSQNYDTQVENDVKTHRLPESCLTSAFNMFLFIFSCRCVRVTLVSNPKLIIFE